MGLIKTPRTRQRTAFSRGDSNELLSPSSVERAARGGAAAESGRTPRARPAGTVLRRQRLMPVCYRELRAMKVMNQSADAKKDCQKWRVDCEIELDQLRKQWVAYQRASRRGKSRVRKAWCEVQPDLDSTKHREMQQGQSTQPFTKTVLRERQVQSPVEVMPSPGKRQRRLEQPVARELFHATPSPRTSLPDSEHSGHSSRRSMDCVALSPAPDCLLEEALAIASRFSDAHQPQEVVPSKLQPPLQRIAAAGRLMRKGGGKCPTGDAQKGRTSRCSDDSGKSSQRPTDPRSSPFRTPCGLMALNRNQQIPAKPPRTPGTATPRGSRPARIAKASLGPPTRVPGKSRTADSHGKLKAAEPLGPAQRTTPKRRTLSATGMPPREASGVLGSCTPRSVPSSTPRGTPRSCRRPQQSLPATRLRKAGPLGKAAPSPRPGLGPTSRLGATQTSVATPRKAYNPKESGSCLPSKLASRPSLGPPKRVLKGAAAGVGTKAARGKSAGALPRAPVSARRLTQ